MSKQKKISNNTSEFLMTLMNDKETYQEKEVNGFWLIKKWNGNIKKWEVNVFTNESYRNYKRGQEKFAEMQQGIDFINSI